MTRPPAVTGRHIGECENALRAVLTGRILDGTGLDYPRWVALLLLATGQGLPLSEAVDRLRTSLKTHQSGAEAVLDALCDQGLLKLADGHLSATVDGSATFVRLSAESARLSAVIFGGIDEADLAVTARVLATVTERANAQLVA